MCTKDHIEGILSIEKRSFHKSIQYRKSVLKEILRDQATFAIMVLGVVAAYVSFERGKYNWYIGSLAVLPEYRGYGYANILLKYIVRKAYEENVKTISLHVGTTNYTALELYLHNQFVVKDVVLDYYPYGSGAFYMEKELWPRKRLTRKSANK